MNLKVGVVAVQGAVTEHIYLLENSFKELRIPGSAVTVRMREDLDGLDALILPGGESTAISKLLQRKNLFDAIIEKVNEGLAIMGTCAGCILLAKEIEEKKIEPLSLMDMRVKRNAFGRQRESFEREIRIRNLQKPYNAVFIRAPLITKVWGKCEVLAKTDEGTIFAREDKKFAISFHPELTEDTRVHRMFLEAAKGN